MSIRWFLVAGVLLWLAYEYASPLWGSLWEKYATHIKFTGGVLVVLGLLCLPSVESLAARHPSVYALVRQYAVDDGLHTDYQQPLPVSAQGLQARVSRGMTLAGADGDTVAPLVATVAAPAPPPAPTVDAWLQASAPALRTAVASAQDWACKRCAGRLYADFRVTRGGAVCGRCESSGV